MKRVKYISILILIFGATTFSCSDDFVKPLGTGDEDEDPIVIPPPPPPSTQNSTNIDSLNLGS